MRGGPERCFQRAAAWSQQSIVFLPSAATLGGRLADAAAYVSFVFKALECLVNRGQRNITACAIDQVLAHGNAIRLGPLSNQGEHHQLFEFAYHRLSHAAIS